jgi:hypothetical protein
MRKLALLVALLALLGLPASAQEYPKGEIFGGFSYARPGTEVNAYGWQVSISENPHRKVGLTADFGGQYKSIGGVTASAYEFLFGPRYTVRGKDLTGFVHGLIGGATVRGAGQSASGFAMGFGGGFDANVNQHISIRILQADYIPTRIGGTWGHSFRLGAGVVVKIGRGS